ncbi:MAG: DUF2854 domain-containing protein [Pseudanabaenaceae cyanobacterium SKYGB_i_bin29]|nr:DUF2854 domain-containing protein [Pseudanabaenaceae cyanobacterium SKYG29]MDW8420601.1 DUF2854 domain-containing protein [Pseudanabaenaceae cyanobacterium SKYGB_i_bin29]
MLGKVSLGKWGLIGGAVLTLVGVVAYATNNPTLNLVGFFYGIPLFLGGAALKAAELKPVPLVIPTTPAVLQLRQSQATPTLKQLYADVTRYRYGTEAHLLEALQRLQLSPNDRERPLLVGIYETDRGGKYALVLRFSSPHFDLGAWQARQDKISRFFGPGVVAEITSPAEHTIDVALVVT